MKSCKLKSYAKVNLYLEVLKKRADGYHQILTLFERISLFDEINIRPRLDKKIRIFCSEPQIPKGKGNLAYRAASLLKTVSGIDKGADIRIKKRIPAAAGLAGGSSNAASVLLGLNRLWGLNLSKKRLISYAKQLGSDVPFFLANASFALGKSRGDDIKAVKGIKIKLWHILAVPKTKVSTKTIYRGLDKIADFSVTGLTKAASNVKILIRALKESKVPMQGERLFNRLEGATFGLYPQVERLKNKMRDLGVKAVLMSGSGPAVFGIVSSRKEAEAICRKLYRLGYGSTFAVSTA